MVQIPLRRIVTALAALALLSFGGCQKAENSSPVNTTAVPAASAAPSPATPNSFSEVTAQLDPGGDLYLYLSTAQWLSKLSHGIDKLHDLALSGSNSQTPDQRDKAEKAFAVAKDMVQKSGLEDITGIGASSFNYTPGLYRNKLFLHHYAEKNSGILWSIYGKAPHPLTGLDMLPVDTSAAAFGDFDLAQLINFLRTEANQSGIPEFKQAMDQWQTQFAGVSGLQLDDVLNSLNGSMGAVLTLDASNVVSIPVAQQVQTIPAPRLAIFIAVKNDLVFKQVDKMLNGNPGVIKTDEPGLSLRTMPIPFIMPTLNLRPSVAQWNGFLVIATDDTIIRNIIAAQKGGPRFKSTAEYATLSAGLPDQGNSFTVITQSFADAVKKFRSQLVANQPGAGSPQGAMQQKIMNHFQGTGRMMAVGALLPNGWLSVGQGSQGAGQLAGPMLIAPAAIAAGAIIPLMKMHYATQPGAAFPPPTSSGPGGMNPSPNPIPGTTP